MSIVKIKLTDALDGGYNSGFEAESLEDEVMLVDTGTGMAGENQISQRNEFLS